MGLDLSVAVAAAVPAAVEAVADALRCHGQSVRPLGQHRAPAPWWQLDVPAENPSAVPAAVPAH
jgi:hypothetical protein